eukprot:TRINITY_DN122770_c0_g1_i1.p1 TRINITY_DN122770_c0_g1~~TRINITY_DN122770_c0_g1_i1.p1  ORF type:complete len:152 (+),score=32.79 TRINITY_DN122770_c0_g1_i1:86-541(+)
MVSFATEPMKVRLPIMEGIGLGQEDCDAASPWRLEATCSDVAQARYLLAEIKESNSPPPGLEGVDRFSQLLGDLDQQKKLELHARGECRPCAYFAFRADGCRVGENCDFCHLCDRAQIRKWKKSKAKASKFAGLMNEFESGSSASSGPSSV